MMGYDELLLPPEKDMCQACGYPIDDTVHTDADYYDEHLEGGCSGHAGGYKANPSVVDSTWKQSGSVGLHHHRYLPLVSDQPGVTYYVNP